MYNEKINTKKLKEIVKNNNLFYDGKNIIALGVDQGYANLGYALVKYNIHTNKYSVCSYGTITTSSKDEIQDRLLDIFNKLKDIITNNNIDVMSCERLFVNGDRQASGNKRRNKSVSIVRTNMSTGIIYLLSSMYQIEIKDFPPTTVKKQLTGNGRADKEEIIQVVEDLMTKQGLKVKTNHESDAIAIAITAISSKIENLLK